MPVARSVVASLVLSLAMLASASSLKAEGGAAAGDPWAIGYAVQVARTCPAWTVEPQRTLASRGILPASPGSPFIPPGGSFERLYYRGQSDAGADSRRNASFCREIRSIAGRNWPRLARVLTPARRGAR